jgi:predicted DNA-binding transcriptional regulator AlpA
MVYEQEGVAARKMIGTRRLLELVPISMSTIERMERKKTFPRGRVVGGRKLWFEDEVADWQNGLNWGQRPSRAVKREMA